MSSSNSLEGESGWGQDGWGTNSGSLRWNRGEYRSLGYWQRYNPWEDEWAPLWNDTRQDLNRWRKYKISRVIAYHTRFTFPDFRWDDIVNIILSFAGQPNSL